MKEQGGAAAVVYEADGKTAEAPAQAILVATGRGPNLEGLNLEAAGVELTARGEVKTDAGLRTSVPYIWAMGDVKGGLQFTYISLDDSALSEVPDSGKWRAHHGEPRSGCVQRVCGPALLQSWNERGGGPVENGHKGKGGRLVVGTMPRAKLFGRTTGLMKAVVDADTGLVLGAQLFCSESQELINMIKIAMDAGLPYTVLRDGIYTHPTMSEGMNDLFAI